MQMNGTPARRRDMLSFRQACSALETRLCTREWRICATDPAAHFKNLSRRRIGRKSMRDLVNTVLLRRPLRGPSRGAMRPNGSKRTVAQVESLELSRTSEHIDNHCTPANVSYFMFIACALVYAHVTKSSAFPILRLVPDRDCLACKPWRGQNWCKQSLRR